MDHHHWSELPDDLISCHIMSCHGTAVRVWDAVILAYWRGDEMHALVWIMIRCHAMTDRPTHPMLMIKSNQGNEGHIVYPFWMLAMLDFSLSYLEPWAERHETQRNDVIHLIRNELNPCDLTYDLFSCIAPYCTFCHIFYIFHLADPMVLLFHYSIQYLSQLQLSSPQPLNHPSIYPLWYIQLMQCTIYIYTLLHYITSIHAIPYHPIPHHDTA